MAGALLCLIGTGLLFAGRVETAALINVRAEAGSAPSSPGEEPEAAVAFEVSPAGETTITTPRSQFQLQAGPRIYYRSPHLGDLERPLVLGRAASSFRYDVTESTRSLSAVGASYGEIDYTSSTVAFDAPLAQNLPDPVITVLSLDARTGFVTRVTSRYSYAFSALAAHTSQETAGAVEDLPKTTSLGFVTGMDYLITELDQVGVSVEPQYSFVSPGEDWLTLTGLGNYVRRLGARTTFTGQGGVTLAKVNGESPSVFPRGSLGLQHIVVERRNARVTSFVRAVLDAPLDPTLGEVRPVAGVEASLTNNFGEDWFTNVSVFGYTATTETDETDPVSAAETSLSTSISAGYRLSQSLAFDWGFRFLTRVDDTFGDDPELVDRQFWGFVGLSGRFSTEDPEAGERAEQAE